LKEIAARNKGETVLLTFFPHPRMVLYPDDNDLKLLNTQDEKIKLLEKAGIDHFVIIPFTKEFSRLTAVEFVRDILVNKIGVKKLVIGYNHHFGRNREGTLEQLKEYAPAYGFKIEEIPAQEVDNVNISSTKIRDALLDGDIQTANSYLGYDYFLSGNVIKGSRIGQTLGFPTANIEVKEKYKLIPADGVYAVKAELDGKIHKGLPHKVYPVKSLLFHGEERLYRGMLNIGVRPTLHKEEDGESKKSIEINIFDFDDDIYDQRLTVYFKARIRDEKKFDDLEALKKQLLIDKETSISLLT
ncbi:bifunctional riboflavin kinase/FMN adenylyltransferase, partial [bacterium AH-315-M05]|nr:bifunctional riboflavin kinase/FMN adenylyltransferase [bacterium AH-315-M05]